MCQRRCACRAEGAQDLIVMLPEQSRAPRQLLKRWCRPSHSLAMRCMLSISASYCPGQPQAVSLTAISALLHLLQLHIDV
jgi:hypothetical protein